MPSDWHYLMGLAQTEVRETVRKLPARLRAEARGLPIMYERRPSRALVADGLAPDTLGLFVGRAFDEEEVSVEPLPPQILLFLENIWDMAEQDQTIYRKEVRATLLHELGHYLGLDELDLEQRGLE